jgi:beta-lactamase regulating signal transducer with metallopeptidase domain
VMLLPIEFRDWSDDEALGVLCHELEHIRRNDWPVFLAERFIAAFYWPNPFVYFLLRVSAASREQAADDAVLRGPVHREVYAARLIAIARALNPNDRPLSALAFASSGNVDSRVRAMFASRRDRRRVSGRFGSYAAIAAMPIVMTLAVAQPWTCVPGLSSQARSTSCT